MNFLEYAKIASLIKSHLHWRDIPDFQDFRSRNFLLDIILSIDREGVSNLYRLLQQKSTTRTWEKVGRESPA